MNCENYKNLIFDLVEGELEESTADEVNSHLVFCRNCEAEFDRLLEEKEIYSHFLFEIEPPENLPQKFRAKLATLAPNSQQNAVNPSALTVRIKNFLESLSLKPVFASATVLLIIFAAFLLIKDSGGENHHAVNLTETPTVGIKQIIAQNPLPEKSSGKEISPSAKPRREASALKISDKSLKNPEPRKQSPDVLKNVSKKAVFKHTSAENDAANFDETDSKFKALTAFKIETAKQFEKIELLLRSFRNVEIDDQGNLFNISYEKQQARKLLDKNAQLREKARAYGNVLFAETLDKYEPYLLDIANLENNPSTAQIAEIKERVRNQNAVLSLQAINY